MNDNKTEIDDELRAWAEKAGVRQKDTLGPARSSEERTDPRLARSKHELGLKLAKHCLGRSVDRQTLHECEEILRDHRVAARLSGVDFPEMVVLVMERLGTVDVFRRDLDELGMGNVVVELAQRQRSRKYYDPGEIARAVRRAWPGYKAPEAGSIANG